MGMKAPGFFGNPSYLGSQFGFCTLKPFVVPYMVRRLHGFLGGFFVLRVCLNLLGDGIPFLDFCSHITCWKACIEVPVSRQLRS